MIRRPPRSTLFPYTPLSRSQRVLDRTATLGSDFYRFTDSNTQAARALRIFCQDAAPSIRQIGRAGMHSRSEEHTSELQSHLNLVCRLLLEKKKNERQ